MKIEKKSNSTIVHVRYEKVTTYSQIQFCFIGFFKWYNQYNEEFTGETKLYLHWVLLIKTSAVSIVPGDFCLSASGIKYNFGFIVNQLIM